MPSGMNDRNAEGPISATARPGLYRLGQSGGRNLSDTSINSEALLDHRLVLPHDGALCKTHDI